MVTAEWWRKGIPCAFSQLGNRGTTLIDYTLVACMHSFVSTTVSHTGRRPNESRRSWNMHCRVDARSLPSRDTGIHTDEARWPRIGRSRHHAALIGSFRSEASCSIRQLNINQITQCSAGATRSEHRRRCFTLAIETEPESNIPSSQRQKKTFEVTHKLGSNGR